MLRMCLWFASPIHKHLDIYASFFGSSCHRFSPNEPLPAKIPWNDKKKLLIKVCERYQTDQSLFNMEARGNYLRLPYSYNVQPTRWKYGPPVNASNLAILHFFCWRPEAVEAFPTECQRAPTTRALVAQGCNQVVGRGLQGC